MSTTPALLPKEVQHRVFYLDGHLSRYQPCPTGLNFGERTGTGVFPLVIAVPKDEINVNVSRVISTIMHSSSHTPIMQSALLSFGVKNKYAAFGETITRLK